MARAQEAGILRRATARGPKASMAAAEEGVVSLRRLSQMPVPSCGPPLLTARIALNSLHDTNPNVELCGHPPNAHACCSFAPDGRFYFWRHARTTQLLTLGLRPR